MHRELAQHNCTFAPKSLNRRRVLPGSAHRSAAPARHPCDVERILDSDRNSGEPTGVTATLNRSIDNLRRRKRLLRG
jgi:hypothetical protein